MANQEAQNRLSATKILQMVFEYFRPNSVLDVGCGLGSWLNAAMELGVEDIYGIEGPWLDRAQLAVDNTRVSICDLEGGFDLHRKFDLAICLEVAEHLFERSARTFVSSLAAHSDLILFSAAIPFQGGHHHVNEQFPDYWAAHFASLGYRPLDFLRARLWKDPAVLWWLRQNTLLFAHDRLLATVDRFRDEASIARPLSIVHPDVYTSRLQSAQRTLAEHQQLMSLLSQTGNFSVVRQPDGRLTITRI
jgi:SAM-dependent methyltransferase